MWHKQKTLRDHLRLLKCDVSHDWNGLPALCAGLNHVRHVVQ